MLYKTMNPSRPAYRFRMDKTMRTSAVVSVLALTLLGTSGCSQMPIAYGDANSIIAVMEPTLWSKVSDDVQNALEPTILTVAKERTFHVTYQDPNQTDKWANLRRFRQLLLVGTKEEPWMAEPLAHVKDSVDGPGLYKARDVWSRGQQVNILILSQPDAVDEVRQHLSEINEILDDQYRSWVRNRMYISGVDSALGDTLETQAGFDLVVPDVYRWTKPADSVYQFRNDNPDPSQLIREVTVTWRTPILGSLNPDELLRWRHELTSTYYNERQDVDLSLNDSGPTEYRGDQAYQIQAVWKNPPDLAWPAAGPFILRAIDCPAQNRTYLLDAWLYAPNRDKYQYMIQLETILDTFRCGVS